MTKYVYSFNEMDSTDYSTRRGLLGGKGAGLAEMSSLDIPVPPGFTVSTLACELFQKGKNLPDYVVEEINLNLRDLEEKTGKTFGGDNPLLVSVRSGAAISMPGMMDTILNLGLNDKIVEVLAAKTANPKFAYDAYRRFLQMFGNVVLGLKSSLFEDVLKKIRKIAGVSYDSELKIGDLKLLIEKFKLVIKEAGKEFPQDPRAQLSLAISAVFNSWNNPRAVSYRRLNRIKGIKGTAVNIQAMVFGNYGDSSGTGVCFTRSPSTGENELYGEYLVNAQGEDVVAGIRTPQPISHMKKQTPQIYEELLSISKKLETHFKDMQDIEFTIEEGKLFILQTRSGKRTATAALKVAIDMVNQSLITKEEAILSLNPNQLDHLLHKQLDESVKSKASSIAKGLPASPGAAVGKIVFTAEQAVSESKDGERTILVRTETSPEDIEGMHSAVGILTSRGGMTSHAAVVARGMGKCCVVGCSGAIIDEKNQTLSIGKLTLKKGDYISLDGSTGAVYSGIIPTVDPVMSDDFKTVMDWADSFRSLGVRANADSPKDSAKAIELGAEGIGLCRTEHMFFEGKRITAMREMILAKDESGRKKALDKLLPYQRSDFEGIFKEMGTRPVTIRLLDPPLHEFLPQTKKEMTVVAEAMNVSISELKRKMDLLRDINPMLGHRGCRLGITYPEITRMQTRAIIEAALLVEGANPEIMVPLVGNVTELANQKKIILDEAQNVFIEKGKEISFMIGTMIEVPRAAITADEIAREADFFSFGTNDLTQMTLGFSRDDTSGFLPAYLDKGLIEADPFQTIDKAGVGQVVDMAVKKGRSTNKKLKLGICGEHGGDPESIHFCNSVGIDYVSCSPFRIPIARLAAAQAEIKKS